MPSTTATAAQSDTDRSKGLVDQYRAIGPAAILAALICASRSKLKASFGR